VTAQKLMDLGVLRITDAFLTPLKGLYNYGKEEDDEMSFSRGELIVVLEEDPSGWWKVCPSATDTSRELFVARWASFQ
jgi:hypothetical protein